MGTLAELQANPDRLYPLLWLSNEGGSLEDNYKIDNVRLTMFGRVISGEEGQDDDASEIEVLSDMQLILLDFLNYFHQQHAQEYVVAKSASLEHFTERTNDRTAGYSCVLELKQFYDWNKCQIPESGAGISPSVDGLTLYDFCDQSVLDRLTATQTACLEDEFGSVCAPAILTANTATFTTVASGGTLDIQVHDTADANVGTVASTSEIEIGNSSNEVNGVDIAEPTVAEGTHNQVIQNSAATPVGTAANPSVISDAIISNSNSSYSVSVVAQGSLTIPNITFIDSDGASSSVPSVEDITCTPQIKSVFIKFGFLAANGETGALTIDADNAGTFTSTADDGGSGTITYDVNGGGFATFSNPTALAIGDTIAAKRTTTTSDGYTKITGTYV